jgi:transcriptional regulator with GAF, ATPase, and Fis domain
MQVYGTAGSPNTKRGTRAGLLLLYAPEFTQLSPAYLLTSGELLIGRDPHAGICIPQAAASRQHARIRHQDDHWVLTDLGGRNGTLVDGAFIREVRLEHLHEIRIGDAIFKFVEADAESYAPYRIDGARSRREGEADSYRLPHPLEDRTLVGGYQIGRLTGFIERVAKSEISVIILGESGTGKEVLARHLHVTSGRRGAFQTVNCAAIPASLLESELFGYKRGAFSGADRDKMGLFRAADQGTLFLDEIGDMPLDAQAKLLRVLQSREVVPVGATTPERIDVRVACATHRDLGKLQQEGRFRGDLYARLNEYSVVLPPLRERKEDIYLLSRALLARHGRSDLGLTFQFMTGLLHYDYPFNVRELESFIKRGIALADGPDLDRAHLPEVVNDLMKSYGRRSEPRAPSSHLSASGRVETPTETELRALLVAHHGNVAAVGRQFGKERMQVHRWMKRYGIDIGDYR